MASSPSGITVHTILSFIPAAHSLHIAAHRSSSLLVLSGRSRSLLHAPVSPYTLLLAATSPSFILHAAVHCTSPLFALKHSSSLQTAPHRLSSLLHRCTSSTRSLALPLRSTSLHIVLTRLTCLHHVPRVIQLVSASFPSPHIVQLHSVVWECEGLVHEARAVGYCLW